MCYVACRRLCYHRPPAVYLTDAFHAEGFVYLDDEHTFNYAKQDKFRLRFIKVIGDPHEQTIKSQLREGSKQYAPDNLVERIVLKGVPREPTKVTITDHRGEVRIAQCCGDYHPLQDAHGTCCWRASSHAPPCSCTDGLLCLRMMVWQVTEGTWLYDDATKTAVLRKPAVRIAYDWSIHVQYGDRPVLA